MERWCNSVRTQATFIRKSMLEHKRKGMPWSVLTIARETLYGLGTSGLLTMNRTISAKPLLITHTIGTRTAYIPRSHAFKAMPLCHATSVRWRRIKKVQEMVFIGIRMKWHRLSVCCINGDEKIRSLLYAILQMHIRIIMTNIQIYTMTTPTRLKCTRHPISMKTSCSIRWLEIP